MSKLDWMYKSSNTVDPEEYLLGRSIDKNYEKQSSSHNEVDRDILPTSIFAGANSNVQVDVFRKKKEDPLEQIKLKEIEMRKQLLKNPVKLKKLQSMLKAKEDKKNHKGKKKKKSKDKDIDDLLAEKYMKLINKYGAKNLVELTKSDEDSDDDDKKVKKKKQRKRESSSSSSLSLSSEDERSGKRRNSSPQRKDSSKRAESAKKKRKRGSRSRSRGSDREESKWRSRSRGSDGGGREKSRGQKDRCGRSPHVREDSRRSPYLVMEDQKGQKRPQVRQRSLSPSSSEESLGVQNETVVLLEQRSAGKKDYEYSSDEGKSRFKKTFGLVLPKGMEPNSRPQLSDSRGDVKTAEAKSTNKYVRSKPTRLTEEEKQAKLKEMVEDAQKWEKTRKSKVTKYREEQKKEDAQEKKFDGEFMRKELAKATSKSVAERIKSNINNLQRAKFSMDQHFTKRT